MVQSHSMSINTHTRAHPQPAAFDPPSSSTFPPPLLPPPCLSHRSLSLSSIFFSSSFPFCSLPRVRFPLLSQSPLCLLLTLLVLLLFSPAAVEVEGRTGKSTKGNNERRGDGCGAFDQMRRIKGKGGGKAGDKSKKGHGGLFEPARSQIVSTWPIHSVVGLFAVLRAHSLH